MVYIAAGLVAAATDLFLAKIQGISVRVLVSVQLLGTVLLSEQKIATK